MIDCICGSKGSSGVGRRKLLGWRGRLRLISGAGGKKF